MMHKQLGRVKYRAKAKPNFSKGKFAEQIFVISGDMCFRRRQLFYILNWSIFWQNLPYFIPTF